MMGHKICFYGEMWLIIPKLPLLPLLSSPLRMYRKSYCITPGVGSGGGVDKMLKVLRENIYVMGKVLSGELSCTWICLLSEALVLALKTLKQLRTVGDSGA